MNAASALDTAIGDVDRLARVLSRSKRQIQVRSSDERALAKATAQTWFINYRPLVASFASEEEISLLDARYRTIIETSERAGSRAKYFSTLKVLRQKIIRLRSECLAPSSRGKTTADAPPDFSPLISDEGMQTILVARWLECTLCLQARAPLAATVMMGGLLEAILLARINRELHKPPIFKAKSAPRDHQGVTRQLKDWMLSDYIRVAHELAWISVPVKDVGEVLRDYRNYIHPYKQLTHGVHLSPDDAALFWEVTKNITRQVIKRQTRRL